MARKITVKEWSRIERDGNANKYHATARDRKWSKEDRQEENETLVQVILWLGGFAVLLTVAMFIGLVLRS